MAGEFLPEEEVAMMIDQVFSELDKAAEGMNLTLSDD